MLSPTEVRPAVEAVLRDAKESLCAYQILEALPPSLRDQIIAERGLPGSGSGNRYSAATFITQSVESLLPEKDAPWRVYLNKSGVKFPVAGQMIAPGNSMIAFYRLNSIGDVSAESESTTADATVPAISNSGFGEARRSAADSEPTVISRANRWAAMMGNSHPTPEQIDYLSALLSETEFYPEQDAEGIDPLVFVPLTDAPTEKTNPDGRLTQQFPLMQVFSNEGKPAFPCFTTREKLKTFVGNDETWRYGMPISNLCRLFQAANEAQADIEAIVINPGMPGGLIVSGAFAAALARGKSVTMPEAAKDLDSGNSKVESIDTSDILAFYKPSEILSSAVRAQLKTQLAQIGITNAISLIVVKTDMSRSLWVGLPTTTPRDTPQLQAVWEAILKTEGLPLGDDGVIPLAEGGPFALFQERGEPVE